MAMFESLSDRLTLSLKKISGKASLSEKNIEETLREGTDGATGSRCCIASGQEFR